MTPQQEKALQEAKDRVAKRYVVPVPEWPFETDLDKVRIKERECSGWEDLMRHVNKEKDPQIFDRLINKAMLEYASSNSSGENQFNKLDMERMYLLGLLNRENMDMDTLSNELGKAKEKIDLATKFVQSLQRMECDKTETREDREVEFAIKFHDWYADKLSFNNRPDDFFHSVNDGNGNASTEKAMQLFLKQIK